MLAIRLRRPRQFLAIQSNEMLGWARRTSCSAFDASSLSPAIPAAPHALPGERATIALQATGQKITSPGSKCAVPAGGAGLLSGTLHLPPSPRQVMTSKSARPLAHCRWPAFTKSLCPIALQAPRARAPACTAPATNLPLRCPGSVPCFKHQAQSLSVAAAGSLDCGPGRVHRQRLGTMLQPGDWNIGLWDDT
jgi:hypothetical protein